ncbi:hypothetical protein Tco_1536146 [Tanacetum coccineum]
MFKHFFFLMKSFWKKVRMLFLRLEMRWMKTLRSLKLKNSNPSFHTTEEAQSPPPKKEHMNLLMPKKLMNLILTHPLVLYDKLTEDKWDKHVEAVASYVDLKNAVKEDPALNKKVLEATKSSVESLQAIALRQDDHLATWAKSSTSMAWNLGPRLTSIESTQFALKCEISSLRQDTSNINSMMTQIFQAFKENSSSAPSNIVPTTLALIEDPTTVGGECHTSCH